MWAWSDPSLPVQLSANHGQLKGSGRMTCSSVDIIDVVRCRILLLPPPSPFSVHNPEHVAAGAESYHWN